MHPIYIYQKKRTTSALKKKTPHTHKQNMHALERENEMGVKKQSETDRCRHHKTNQVKLLTSLSTKSYNVLKNKHVDENCAKDECQRKRKVKCRGGWFAQKFKKKHTQE